MSKQSTTVPPALPPPAHAPRWMQRRRPQWFPRYVHMLRINPDKLDRVGGNPKRGGRSQHHASLGLGPGPRDMLHREGCAWGLASSGGARCVPDDDPAASPPGAAPQVEQDALWSLMGRDEPEVLQASPGQAARFVQTCVQTIGKRHTTWAVAAGCHGAASHTTALLAASSPMVSFAAGARQHASEGGPPSPHHWQG